MCVSFKSSSVNRAVKQKYKNGVEAVKENVDRVEEDWAPPKELKNEAVDHAGNRPINGVNIWIEIFSPKICLKDIEKVCGGIRDIRIQLYCKDVLVHKGVSQGGQIAQD